MNTVVQQIKADYTAPTPVEANEKYQITAVPIERCMEVWPIVRPMLEPAVVRSSGRWTMDHLLVAIHMGHHVLWVAYTDAGEIKGAMTSQVVDYPATRMVAVQFLGGGDFFEWGNDMLDVLENYARDVGAKGIESCARLGFWGFFKKRGYDRSYALYEGSVERKE